MRLVADENMPYVREWFARYGDVYMLPGRALNAQVLSDADALLVRSVTRVDGDLLRGSRVRFVGTATSGIEHIDIEYLRAQGIAYASAPGCNATAVVEYVLSSICALDDVLEKLLTGGVVGIIGLGNVGARLTQRLRALGIRCVGYDPFLSAEGLGSQTDLSLCDFETVLNADVVCCHTPLTIKGPYPTRHLLDAQRLRRLRKGAALINASRGAVVDNAALLRIAQERDDLRIALDVWESEPAIDLPLLNAVALATPHIAGYSWDGKVAGTRAILTAFCNFFHVPLPEQALATPRPIVSFSSSENSAILLRSAIQSVYDVRRDDREMRAMLLACASGGVAAAFDRLRKNYPQRREIAACAIENWTEFDAASQSLLQRLGFLSL